MSLSATFTTDHIYKTSRTIGLLQSNIYAKLPKQFSMTTVFLLLLCSVLTGLSLNVAAETIDPNLDIALTATPDPVQPGEQVEYVLTAVNRYTVAKSLFLYAQVPEHTTVAAESISSGGSCDGMDICTAGQLIYWSLSYVDPGQSISVQFSALVDDVVPPPDGTLIRSTATVRALTDAGVSTAVDVVVSTTGSGSTDDTDEDGMPDDWELLYSLDPYDATDALGDLDGDGIYNLAEYIQGTSPVSADTDSDGDGLADAYEIENNLNPLLSDSDDDGIDDGDEILDIGTDPLVGDTDGDCVLDGVEVIEGTVPTDPLDKPTFVSPVLDPLLTNGFSVANPDVNNELHTGIDLISITDDRIIRAAHTGTAVLLPIDSYWNENHDMGNVVIIISDASPPTLYAHLESFDTNLASDPYVCPGDPIGQMGNTGCEDSGCGVHLHFELKHFPVLGNLDHDGLEWGYTPEHPNLYGYLNPYAYLDHDVTEIGQVIVEINQDQPVRTRSTVSPDVGEFDHVTAGQQFVAFAQADGMFQIQLPSKFGPAAGWVEGIPTSSENYVLVDDPFYDTNPLIGVSVCPTPAACSSTGQELSYVWQDQWLIELDRFEAGNGCTKSWILTALPQSADQVTGWICGEYLDIEEVCALPEAPDDLTAKLKRDTISLTWSDSNDAVSYNIYRSIDNEDFVHLDSTSNTTYLDKPPTDTKTVQYFITAVNDCGGVSEPSESVELVLSRGGGGGGSKR